MTWRSYASSLAVLAILAGLLVGCKGSGKSGTSGGNPSVACNVSETPIAGPDLKRLSAAATATGGGPTGDGGNQSGGTNQPVAGGDTNVTVFCGKDADPIFTGPGGTTTKNSGNTTAVAP